MLSTCSETLHQKNGQTQPSRSDSETRTTETNIGTTRGESIHTVRSRVESMISNLNPELIKQALSCNRSELSQARNKVNEASGIKPEELVKRHASSPPLPPPPPPSAAAAAAQTNSAKTFDTSQPKTSKEREEIKEKAHMIENEEIHTAFEGLPWEVECTVNVSKILHEKRVEMWKKKLIIHKLQALAQGRKEWGKRDHMCRLIDNNLYETRLTDCARILWECTIAFSPRLSHQCKESEGTTSMIYSEVIRVWDIVFDHDNLPRKINQIKESRRRGKDCIQKKDLIRIREDVSQNQGPKLYTKVSESSTSELSLDDPEIGASRKENEEKIAFFPLASSNDNEYQVLKFYSFSSAMIHSILEPHDNTKKIDFPFKVTEEEYDIINYHPSTKSSLIVMGRSGTGKTTCILYRLWKELVGYWEKTTLAEPLIPKDSDLIPTDLPCPESVKAEEDIDCTNTTRTTRTCTSASETAVAHDPSGSKESGTYANACGNASNVKEVASCGGDADGHPNPGETEEVNNTSGSSHAEEHFHQLFLTKNDVLCQEIKKNVNALSEACSSTQHLEVEYALPLKLQQVQENQWPLLANSSEFYRMLDASLGEPTFFARDEDGRLLFTVQDDEGTLVHAIPTLDEDDEEDESMDESKEDGKAKEKEKVKVKVTYTVFESKLWSKVCKRKKTKNLHPSLVWMEIQSFIKGSSEALHTKNGCLSLEEYQEIGRKRAPNFTADREVIYELFLAYERVKKSLEMFDESDLVYNLYRRLRASAIPAWSVHRLYVDEAQDFTQAELMLLICCCRDPNNIFLAGDTAQSVMRGISFRFSDLRSLFYYLKKEKNATMPDVIPLVYNYRSHNNILRLASSVVNIMQRYFPESFDQLQEDRGQFDGPKPVLLGSFSQADLAILLRGNQRNTSIIEFGAHQAILVASNKARDMLPEELSHALVLTIYESKGLEFDDVLIYNFFKDSQVGFSRVTLLFPYKNNLPRISVLLLLIS